MSSSKKVAIAAAPVALGSPSIKPSADAPGQEEDDHGVGPPEEPGKPPNRFLMALLRALEAWNT